MEITTAFLIAQDSVGNISVVTEVDTGQEMFRTASTNDILLLTGYVNEYLKSQVYTNQADTRSPAAPSDAVQARLEERLNEQK